MKSANHEVFREACECYAQQKYSQASQLYEKITDKSPEIWFNMGNCAYKNSNYLDALIFWNRAQKLGSADVIAASTRNIPHAQEKLTLSPQKAATRLPYNPLLLQILFFCTFSVFLISNRWLWKTKKFILLAALSVSLLAVGIMSYSAYKHATTLQGIITREDAALYAGPHTGYHQLGTLSQGIMVTIMSQKQGWKKITRDGMSGWIENDKIEVI